jgi:hypothetical protein
MDEWWSVTVNRGAQWPLLNVELQFKAGFSVTCMGAELLSAQPNGLNLARKWGKYADSEILVFWALISNFAVDFST